MRLALALMSVHKYLLVPVFIFWWPYAMVAVR